MVGAAQVGGFQECSPIKGPQWTFPTDGYAGSDLFGVSISSDLYESFVVNLSCAKAASYIKQLIAETLPNTKPGALNSLTAGPGFTCIAYPDKNGRAYGGSCVSGSAKFDWNYNVIWHGVPDSSAGEGGLGVEPMGAIEYSTILRPLGNGHYELEVQNASAIGSIDAFDWLPPASLKITAVTSTSGANCTLAADGSISCQGNVQPPQCLCTGSGGKATIDFTATGDTPTIAADGHTVNQGIGWAYLRITAMTPVPYLVPDTPETSGRSHGV